MLDLLACALLPLLLASLSPAAGQESADLAAKPLEIDYAVFLEQGEVPKLRCKMTLWNVTGPMELELPQGTTYIRLDEPILEGEVTARSTLQKPVPIERTGPYSWRVEPGAVDEIEFDWLVPVVHRDVPEIAERDAYEWPYIAKDHAFLPTAHFLLVPVLDASEAKALDSVRVRLFGPSGWAFHAPWKELKAGFFQPPGLAALSDDILLAGAWEIDHFDAAEVELAAAFAPGQESLRAVVSERLSLIVPAQLELFGMQPLDKYLFVFGRPDMQNGYAGSPKTNSMTLCVADNLPADFAAKGLSHLIGHEFFHVWQRARCTVEDEVRFVSEGFTDWFAYRTAARQGLYTADELLLELAGKLAEAETSMSELEGALPSAGGPAFFEGGEAYRATYAGGLVLALALDLGLQRQDGEPQPTLEAVLQHLWNDPRWDGAPNGTGPGLNDFFASLEAVAGAELTELARAFVGGTGRPDLVAFLAQVGLDVERSGSGAAPRYVIPPNAAPLLGISGG